MPCLLSPLPRRFACGRASLRASVCAPPPAAPAADGSPPWPVGIEKSGSGGPAVRTRKYFFAFVEFGEVDDEAAAEAAAHRRRGDQLELVGVLRIELEDGARAAAQALVQRLEEAEEPLARHVLALVGVAQPLHRRDRDGAVEDALAERHAAAHVAVHEVAADAAPLRDAQHVERDVEADPLVPRLLERLAAEPGAAADVEQQARAGPAAA